MVSLTGDARAVGEQWGRVNAESVRASMTAALASWRKTGLTDAEMKRRTEKFSRFIDRFAPHWLDELAGCAKAAGVPADDYLVFEAGSPRSIILMHECTSFAAVGSATADGAPLFHRVRDNRGQNNCAFYKAVAHASRPAAFFAVGNTPHTLAVSCFVNEHGLAGSADMGGLKEDRPTGRGLMNSHVIRHVAERAARCEDALEIVQEMIRDRWYAGGKQGTHWLFVDRHGKVLRVAHNSHEERHWLVDDGTVFSRRGDTAAGKLLTAKEGRLALPDMIASARHAAICGTASIAGFSVRLDAAEPAALSSLWIAQPAWVPYIPVYPIARAVPRAAFDGTCSRRGFELLPHHRKPGKGEPPGAFFPGPLGRRRDAVQDELFADAAEVERAVRAAQARGETSKAAALAADGATAACAKLLRFLAEAQDT